MAFKLPAQLKMAEAASTAAAAVRAVAQGERQIDCSGLQAFDSSALSVLLAAKRALPAASQAEGLRIEGYPEKLQQLAQLYGINTLLFSNAP